MISIYDGLDEEQKVKFDMCPPPHMFAVISWGCSATTWLAGALNSHPDIFCVHGANHSWATLGNAPLVDGLEYLRIIGTQGSTHIAAGDVHGINSAKVPELEAAFGENFSCVSLVRDPVKRLRSLMAVFERYERFRWWGDMSYVKQMLPPELSLPDDAYLNQLFVFGVNMLNAVITEKQLGPIYRAEDLTSNPEILCQFVGAISNGKVNADQEWAAKTVSRRGVNSHVSRTGDAQSLVLESWQKDVIRHIVTAETWEIYASLDYEIPDFVQPGLARV